MTANNFKDVLLPLADILFQETIYPFVSPPKTLIHTFVRELKSVIQLREVSIIHNVLSLFV